MIFDCPVSVLKVSVYVFQSVVCEWWICRKESATEATSRRAYPAGAEICRRGGRGGVQQWYEPGLGMQFFRGSDNEEQIAKKDTQLKQN